MRTCQFIVLLIAGAIQATAFLLPHLCRSNRVLALRPLLASVSGDVPTDAEEDEYWDPNVDMFGDRMDIAREDEEEYLKELRYNKTIANDRWQSNIFREASCGRWKGVYEVFMPRASEELQIGKTAFGIVETETRSTIPIFDGTNIVYNEKYIPSKSSSSVPSVPAKDDAYDASKLLTTCTKDMVEMTRFRPVSGNQIVGEAYTICSSQTTSQTSRKKEEEESSVTEEEVMKDAMGDFEVTLKLPNSLVAELSIKEGLYRTRVRYVYTTSPTPSLTSEEVTAGLYDMSLLGFTVIREQQLSNETGHLQSTEDKTWIEEKNKQLADSSTESFTDPSFTWEQFFQSPYYMSVAPIPGSGVKRGDPFDTTELGTTLYDPQRSGDPFVELTLPGKLTVFFPRGLIANKDSVMSMQWEGKVMRYQLDRKFSSLGNVPTTQAMAEIAAGKDTYLNRRAAATSESITSFELTEIRTDLTAEYPDALFNPSPEFLK